MYSGSLWVTHHTDRKIEGASSVPSLCSHKCAYEKFCYSEHLLSFMRNLRDKAEHNYLALKGTSFIPPMFDSIIVRWFSFGSCNGDVNTLIHVREAVETNPDSYHGIWIEPHFWSIANRYLGEVDGLQLVYSNKVLDSVHVPAPWYNSFNVGSTEEATDTMVESCLANGVRTIKCSGKCKDCGWICYKDSGVTVVECKR